MRATLQVEPLADRKRQRPYTYNKDTDDSHDANDKFD